MNKKLTEEEMEEVQELLTDKNKVALYVAIVGSVAAIISSIGTALASVIIAIKSKGR